MKTVVLVCIAMFTFNVTFAGDWLHSFEDAKKMALASNKLMLVDFWATWCGPCKRMDLESWNKDEVKVLMDNFVAVKIDIDRHRQLAQKYGVKGIPYIFIMDGNGKVLYHEMSYKRKNEVINLLTKYALNTSYLQQELVHYFHKATFASTFRLASKYQDFSLHIKDEAIKKNILNIAESYFDESKSLLKDSELENKDNFFKKIALFEIQELLIINKPDKALKKLEEIEVVASNGINQSFYNFLNYVAYSQLKDATNSELWKSKLEPKDIKKGDLFLQSN